MSELEKTPNCEDPPASRINEGSKKEILNLDLTVNEKSELLTVDVECGSENQVNEFLTKSEEVEESANRRRLINVELEDLAEPIKPQRLKVVLGNDYHESPVDNTKNCNFCGSIIKSHQNQCNVCFSRTAGSSDHLEPRKALRVKPFIYTGMIITFILLLILVMQINLDTVAPEPTPPPVPSTPEPVPIPKPDLPLLADTTTIQDAINVAKDGDVIAIQEMPYYGPLDFKGKNLSIVLDENGGSEYANATKVVVSGAVITLYEAEKIESLLKSYRLVDDPGSDYRKLHYKVQTNYYDYPAYPGTYLELDSDESNLVIKGKASAPGKQFIIKVESGSFQGDHKAESGADAFFKVALNNMNEQEGLRSETVNIDIFHGEGNSNVFNQFYTGLLVKLFFEDKKLVDIMFEKPLAYDGNAKAWNAYREPSQFLSSEPSIQSQDPKIIELAGSLVQQNMSDLQKLVAIHQWVTTNIAYDVKMIASGQRSPQDAVSVIENKLAVCEGYAKLMAALLRSQGISTRYVSGHALGSHDTGRGWEEEGLYNHPIGHAWNEVYVDGEWITVDATWNAGFIDRHTGEFIFDQSFSYFAPSLELFSRTHFIP